MDERYQRTKTVNEQLDDPEFRDEQPFLGSVPTDTIAPNARPTNLPMTSSKAVSAILFGLIVLFALIVLLFWLL